jgi:hypothetical protein
VYDELMSAQIEAERAKKPGDLAALLSAGETWRVA